MKSTLRKQLEEVTMAADNAREKVYELEERITYLEKELECTRTDRAVAVQEARAAENRFRDERLRSRSLVETLGGLMTMMANLIRQIG